MQTSPAGPAGDEERGCAAAKKHIVIVTRMFHGREVLPSPHRPQRSSRQEGRGRLQVDWKGGWIGEDRHNLQIQY